MAIDLTKMRNKLDKLEGKGRSQSVFWKPQDGDQTIRILPMPDGDPFREMWFHYNLGENRGFLSPKKNFGEDDPLDAFVRKLFNDAGDDDIKMAKNLMARQRFFAPVLVRGEESKGIRIWGFGKLAYQQLLELVLNPEYGDITDVDEGTDLIIRYGKMSGKQFPETTITPRRRTSPLCDEMTGGAERCRELLDNIPQIENLFERKTPEEVGQMLEEWLGSVSTETWSSGKETEKYSTEKSDEVQKAFDDLLQQSA